MLSVLGFLVILGPLVIVHEFGHYLFARLFNVKAEAFSVGFGPRLWKKQLGETEFRLSAIPLGGYVKLLGEDPDRELSPEEKKRALHLQKPWKRFFIFFGGPLFNFLFAILVFMVILVIGEPQLASVVGRVEPGTPAAQAGFKSGDRILEMDGQPVEKFSEVVQMISEKPHSLIQVKVKRPGQENPVSLEVNTKGESGFSMYGEETEVGVIDGLYPLARDTRVGVSDPQSLAGQAGIQTDAYLREVNGQTVKNWEEIESIYSSIAPGLAVFLKFEQKGKISDFQFKKPEGKSDLASATGIHSAELFIEQVVKGSPAEKGGLKAGDRLVLVEGETIGSFFDLKSKIQSAGEKKGNVVISWEREGTLQKAEMVPSTSTERDPVLKKITQYTIGVAPKLTWAEGSTVIDRTLNPFMLLFKGTERMVSFTVRNFVSIGKMIKGDVSVATLGGPILIGKIAGDSLSRGLIAFLNMMAILSVGLGVLNILPIPVLDGGHLLLLGIEAVRGRPLSIRQMEVIQQVGLSIILLLMVIVMRNDLSRLAIFN